MSLQRKKRQKQKKYSSKSSAKIEEIEIESLAHDGRGVGRNSKGKVVFIDGALPDETVRYTVIENRKKYTLGSAIEILKTSTHRIKPKCEVYNKCGGCALQHLSADQQIVYKQQQLINNLQKIGNVSVNQILAPIIGDAWSYRRRSRFGATYAQTKNEVRLGFRARHTHFIQPTKKCEIVDEKISTILPDLKEVLSQLRCNESIKGVDICVAYSGLSILVIIDDFMNSDDTRQLIKFAKANKIQIRVQHDKEPEQLIYPKDPINLQNISLMSYQFTHLEGVPDLTMEFAANDFTQVNPEVNALLVSRVLELLKLNNSDRVLDLFCGIGNFTLPLATQAMHVVGVEGAENSIERAINNRDNNQFDNIDFYVCDLFDDGLFSIDECLEGSLLKQENSAWINQHFDLIVLDPPRAGAINIVQHIDRFEARKIIYISCDPATLARDTKLLVHQHGYKLKAAGIADMFPQTAHIESIILFEK